MPTCLYDHEKSTWIESNVNSLGTTGVGRDTCVYDPEHNIVVELIRGVSLQECAGVYVYVVRQVG